MTNLFNFHALTHDCERTLKATQLFITNVARNASNTCNARNTLNAQPILKRVSNKYLLFGATSPDKCQVRAKRARSFRKTNSRKTNSRKYNSRKPLLRHLSSVSASCRKARAERAPYRSSYYERIGTYSRPLGAKIVQVAQSLFAK